MSKRFLQIIGLVCLFMVMASVKNYGQPQLPGKWSIMLGGNVGLNTAVSDDMQATRSEFEQDVINDYTYQKLPFANSQTSNLNFTGQLAYRFKGSALSAFFNYEMTFFYNSNDAIAQSKEEASMLIQSFMPGVEYTLGKPAQLWNCFGRLGLAVNTIVGSMNYEGTEIDIQPAVRLGFMSELGGRVNIPATPLAVEAAVGYQNANLIGKRYNEVEVNLFGISERPHLNDGKNPDVEGDENKTIDYLSIRFGLRMWF